jgi:hypothetical protein
VDRSKLIERVRRALNLSKSSNAHEAALALSIAHRLMQEHRIALHEVSDADSREAFGRREWTFARFRMPPVWVIAFAAEVCKPLGVVVSRDRHMVNRRQVSVTIRLNGRPEATEIAAFYLDQLLEHLYPLALKAFNPNGWITRNNFVTSFFAGAGVVIRHRLEEELNPQAQQAQALMRVDAEAVRKWLMQDEGVTTQRLRGSRLDGRAYSAGARAGAAAPLHKGVSS